jgi:hypothetical protein
MSEATSVAWLASSMMSALKREPWLRSARTRGPLAAMPSVQHTMSHVLMIALSTLRTLR